MTILRGVARSQKPDRSGGEGTGHHRRVHSGSKMGGTVEGGVTRGYPSVTLGNPS